MSAYYSSETTIKNKVKASRINLYGDKNRDGSIDPDSLTQALIFAKQRILMYVEDRYGSQCDDWDSTTVPDALKNISDDLTIFYLASGQNEVNPIVLRNYDMAIDLLEKLNEGKLSLPGVSDFESGTETLTSYSNSIYSNDEDIDDDEESQAFNDDI
jgi:phage gp36-like protein